MQNESTPTPTQSQADQSVIAQHEFAETLDRMIREGVDYRSIMAGAGAALAASIMANVGGAAVSAWFASNALLARGLRDG